MIYSVIILRDFCDFMIFYVYFLYLKFGKNLLKRKPWESSD
jgi:hypothetical protein